jgi:hypothetical protein
MFPLSSCIIIMWPSTKMITRWSKQILLLICVPHCINCLYRFVELDVMVQVVLWRQHTQYPRQHVSIQRFLTVAYIAYGWFNKISQKKLTESIIFDCQRLWQVPQYWISLLVLPHLYPATLYTFIVHARVSLAYYITRLLELYGILWIRYVVHKDCKLHILTFMIMV